MYKKCNREKINEIVQEDTYRLPTAEKREEAATIEEASLFDRQRS